MVEIPYGKRMRPRYVRFLIITVVGVALVAFALDIPWLLITLIVLGVLSSHRMSRANATSATPTSVMIRNRTYRGRMRLQ